MTRSTFLLYLAAAFVVSLGYGVILPIVPLLVERIAGDTSPSGVAWHAGTLSAAYMFAIFIGAPLWGVLSDRIGHRPVILAGLSGYVLMLVLFAFSLRHSLRANVARICSEAASSPWRPGSPFSAEWASSAGLYSQSG